jgi:hypothetical protein
MTRDPLGTAREVADYINKSEKTLANWRSLGIGPAYIKAEGGILYRWRDVEKWLASQLVTPSAASRTA